MPYENDAWRPLNNDEIEEAVVKLRAIVDSAREAPPDHARDFQKEVIDLLCDDNGYRWHEARKISDQLLLEHFMNDAPIKYYRAFYYAADITRQKGLRRLPHAEWERAMPAILRAMSHTTEEQAIASARSSMARLAAQADAAKRLRACGFAIEIYASDPAMTEKERRRLYGLILNEATARGGSSLFHVLALVLERCWQPEFERYVVNLRVNSVPRKAEPSLPLGFLYNIASRVTSVGEGPGAPTLSDAEYYELVSDVCALRGAEPYNLFEVAFQSESGLLELLGDLGNLQFSFTIPQLDERDISRTLRAAFTWVDRSVENRLGWTIDQAIVFCEAVIDGLPGRGAICVPKETIRRRLRTVAPGAFEALWSTFVHLPRIANARFSNPMDASEANAYFKPLIGFGGGDQAAIGLRSVSAVGWYEAVATALRNAAVSEVEQRIGNAFEDFVRVCLAGYAKVYSGTFSSMHANGDVDAAIATDSTILLFELKKKALTRSAQSGNVLDVMLDLAKSLVKAQAQLAKIEYVLRADGSIALGGDVLELQGRELKRITLSWHDYGVFHEHAFTMNFLQKLAGASIISPDANKASQIVEINEYLAELGGWEQKVASLVAPPRMAFKSSFFYAIGHLLSMMRFCESDKQLCQHLTYNEYVGRVALDFYVEYGDWLRRILPGLPAV